MLHSNAWAPPRQSSTFALRGTTTNCHGSVAYQGMDSSKDKDYLECGTQTSPPRSPTCSVHLTLTPKGSSVTRFSDGYPSSSSNASPNTTTGSFSSTRLGTASSHSFCANSDISSPACSRLMQRNLFKAQQLGYSRPSEPRKPVARAVSLPDPAATPEATNLRVVSLPERPKPTVLVESPSLIRFRPVSSKRPYLLGDGNFYRRTLAASDLPQTPSPPSSPESSVLIIGNDVDLPQTFLRHNDTMEPQFECDNGGTFTSRVIRLQHL